MFRASRLIYSSLRVTPLTVPTYRLFHASAFTLAKNNKKAKKETKKDKKEPEADDIPVEKIVNLDEVKIKFENVLEKFGKRANEFKLGKTNPAIFDNLDVDLGDKETVKFNTVAQTQVKGRNLNITVYDPNQVQSIINSILGSDLNMNPTFDSLTSTLKVPLPPVTTETKQESVKQFKQVFEKFKSNNSNSLNSVRTDYKQKFKKLKLKSDSEKQLVKDFESLHKQYLDKLTDVFKNTEKLIMK